MAARSALKGLPAQRALAADDAEELEAQLAAALQRIHATGCSAADIVASDGFHLIKSVDQLRGVIKRRGLPDGSLKRNAQEILTASENADLLHEIASRDDLKRADACTLQHISASVRSAISSRSSDAHVTPAEQRIMDGGSVAKSHAQKLLARAA